MKLPLRGQLQLSDIFAGTQEPATVLGLAATTLSPTSEFDSDGCDS